VQFKDHDDLPKSDQRRIPQSGKEDIIAYQHRLLARILRLRPSAHLGNFQPAQVGIIRPAVTVVLPWSLLIRGILAALRQIFHLSACPNLPGHL
jgi:hypothetical protein